MTLAVTYEELSSLPCTFDGHDNEELQALRLTHVVQSLIRATYT